METLEKTIKQAKGGDSAAFQAIYQHTARELGWYCRHLTGNDADADDLMQETYLTAWQKLGSFQEGSLPAWLRTIARNTWINTVRREKPQLLSEELTDSIPEDELLSPANQTEQKLIRELIFTVLEQELSAPHRMTVLLYYYDRKTIPEIAAEMECSEGTVKSRLYYARRKLREALTGRGITLASGVPLLTPMLQENAAHAAIPDIQHILPHLKTARLTAKAASGAVKGKIIAGAAAAVVAGGTATAVAFHQQRSRSEPPQTVIEMTETTPRPTVPAATAYTPPPTEWETVPETEPETEPFYDPQPGGALRMQEFGTSQYTVYFRIGIPENFLAADASEETAQETGWLDWQDGHLVDGRFPIRFTARDGSEDCIIVIGRDGGPEVPLPADFLSEELDSVSLGAFTDTEYAVDTEHWEVNSALPSTFTAQRADFTGEKDGNACTGTVIYWETAMDERYPAVGSVYFLDYSGIRAQEFADAEQSLIFTEETVNKREHVRPTIDPDKIPREFSAPENVKPNITREDILQRLNPGNE